MPFCAIFIAIILYWFLKLRPIALIGLFHSVQLIQEKPNLIAMNGPSSVCVQTLKVREQVKPKKLLSTFKRSKKLDNLPINRHVALPILIYAHIWCLSRFWAQQ